MIALMWVMAAHGVDRDSIGLTATLAFAYAFGPIGMTATMTPRELRTLPVTNRDLWVATWVAATMAVPLALTTAQAVAVLGVITATGSSAVPPQSILFTAVYSFAYAGALMPLLPSLGHSLGNIEGRRPRWLWITLSIAYGATFLVAFGAPYYFVRFLPLTWNDLWWGPALAVIGCLALAGLSLSWTPKRGGVARITGATTAQPPVTQSPPRFMDGLTGIPRIAWPYVTGVLLTCAGALAGFIAYWAVFESDGSLRGFLQNNALLLFDTGFRPTTEPGSAWVTIALVGLATTSPWKAMTRQLKVLPITVGQLNVLVLLTPFVQWSLVWMALIVTHVAVIGVVPGSLHLDLFVALGGVSALGQVLMLRRGHKVSFFMIVVFGALMPTAGRISAGELSLPTDNFLSLVGLVALAVAGFVNHRTLTRSTSSSKAFQPDSVPFGFSAPNARR